MFFLINARLIEKKLNLLAHRWLRGTYWHLYSFQGFPQDGQVAEAEPNGPQPLFDNKEL